MEKGIIYKVTNKETEDVYVGITTKSIQERKKDHLKKSKKGKSYAFQNAIGTYGADAFKWEQIDTAVTTDELAKKEKEYILKYNSKEDGYNSDEGGGIKKTVYKYDIISGKLLQKYDDLDSASRTVNSNKKQISKICLSVNQKYRGYFWSYKYEEPFIPNIDSRKKSSSTVNFER